MSRYYEELWINAINSLKNVLMLEKNEEETDLIKMYLKYTSIFSDLNNVFENISGPQQRQAILRTLTLIIVRIIDLKNTTRMHVRDYHPVMRDIKTPIPSCFREEENLRTSRNVFIEECLRRNVSHESKVIRNDDIPPIDKKSEATEDFNCTFIQDCSQSDLEARAVTIQRCFRGHSARIHILNEQKEVRRLVGMEMCHVDDSANSLQKKLLEHIGKLHSDQRNNETVYKGEIRLIKDELRKEEGLKIRQNIRDERIEWATNIIALTNKIPDIEEFYTCCHEENISQSQKIVIAISEDIQEFQNLWLPNMRSPGIYSRVLAKDAVLRKELAEELRISEDKAIQRNFERIRNMSTSSATKRSRSGTDSKLKGKSGTSKNKKMKGLPGDKMEELKGLNSNQMLTLLIEANMICLPNHDKLDGLISHLRDLDGMSTSSFSGNLSEAKRLLTEYCILPNLSKEIKEMLKHDNIIRSILIHGGKGSGKLSAVRAIASEIGAMIIDLNPNNIPESYMNEPDGVTKLVHMVFSVAKDPSYQPVIVSIRNCEKIFQPFKKKSSGTIFSKLQKDLLLYKNQEVTKDRVLIIGCTSAPWEIDTKLLKWKGDSGKPEKQGFFERIIHLPMPGYIERGLMWKDFVTSALKRHGVPPVSIQIDPNILSRQSKGYSGGQILQSVNDVLSSPNAIRNTAKCSPLEIEAKLIFSLEKENELACQQENFEKFNKSLPNILNSNTPDVAEREVKK